MFVNAASTLTVPATTAIDLGGIGKGFAADIVAEELVEMGATGAVVNIGGDLRATGTPSDDASWYLGIEDPRLAATKPPTHLTAVRLQEGGDLGLGDAGVLGLVLREHLVGVAEVVERGDREGDVTPGLRGLGRAAARGEKGECCGARNGGCRSAASCKIHGHSFVCVGVMVDESALMWWL